jgi:hypothetical protein
MSRARAVLRLVDHPELPPLAPGDPADAALWSLLVGLAAKDGHVAGDEVALLRRVRPDLGEDALLAWVDDTAKRGIDWAGLRACATDADAAMDLLRLAARMVALDGTVADGELGIMAELARRVGLPETAPRAALSEVVAEGGPVDADTVKHALRSMWWDVLIPSRDPLESDLDGVVPPGARLLCSIRLGNDEVAGLFVEGLAGRWDGGASFVAWDQIATYTRVPVSGAAFHLRTRDGVDHAMTDPRLGDVGALLDLVHGRQPHGADEP